jgi:hypothetical protein
MFPITRPIGFVVGAGSMLPGMSEAIPPIGSAMPLPIGFPLGDGGVAPPKTLEIISIGSTVGTGLVPPSMLEATPPTGLAVALGRISPMPLPTGIPLGIMPPKMLETTSTGSGVGLGTVTPALKLKLTPMGSTIPLGMMPPMMLPIGLPLGTGTKSPLGIGSVPRETLGIGFPTPSVTLATALSRLPMTLVTGFPVGNGMLFPAVLPSVPTPRLTPAVGSATMQSGRPISAGNAEATKAIEREETIVTCFILEV